MIPWANTKSTLPTWGTMPAGGRLMARLPVSGSGASEGQQLSVQAGSAPAVPPSPPTVWPTRPNWNDSAEAVGAVFEEYIAEHGLGEIAEVFAGGVRIEVGDQLPSEHYAELLKRVPPAWDKAFEVNASENPAVRASCVEFVLAGLHAKDMLSRHQRHGRIEYET